MKKDISDGSKIIIEYTYDYNLVDLNNRILKHIDIESGDRLKQITSELATLNKTIEKAQFFNQRKLALRKIAELEAEFTQIKDGVTKKTFIQDTEHILNKYKTLSKMTTKVSAFFSGGPAKEESPKDVDIRLSLVTTFIDIAKRYAPIQAQRKYTKLYNCIECNLDLYDINVPNDENTETVCPKCGYTIQIFKNQNISEITETSDYEDKENFIKAMIKFQGKQNIIFDKTFFDDLDEYFISKSLPIGDAVRKMEKVDGRRGEEGLVGKRLLRKALASKGYNNHYDNINLIVHEYWGWDLPDISHLEDILIKDYEKTERIFKQIKGNKRKATINTQWRLKQHLIVRGYSPKKDEFKIVETREILEMYDQWWKIMCERCGDSEIRYLRTI